MTKYIKVARMNSPGDAIIKCYHIRGYQVRAKLDDLEIILFEGSFEGANQKAAELVKRFNDLLGDVF